MAFTKISSLSCKRYLVLQSHQDMDVDRTWTQGSVVHGGPAMDSGDEALAQSVAFRFRHREFGRKTDLFWPPTMNGGSGVLTRVDEVGQPWRKKGGGRRSSGGETSGYEFLLYQRGGGRRRFREGERPALVMNQCRLDYLRAMSPDHGKRMKWDPR
jgi:hypothetical protein